jgi:NhaA family Na+:H+ antiporter
MAAPAVIYVALNAGSAETLRGWAIPAATDIAFALGVLALLGSRVPVSLKIFLTALAILDDLGAVLILAMFYTAGLSVQWLGLAGVVLVVLAGFNRAGMTSLAIYLLLGAVLWFFVLKSGVHATLAGVALAFTVPLRASPGLGDYPASPVHRLEHAIHPWVAFLIVPLFGFANAGVSLSGMSAAALGSSRDPGCRLRPVLRQTNRDIFKHLGNRETWFGVRARRIILAPDLRNFRQQAASASTGARLSCVLSDAL